MYSKFIDGSGRLATPIIHFEKWLLQQGYQAASDAYTGSVHAATLIDQFLRDRPGQKGNR
jgi:hypothetical protein